MENFKQPQRGSDPYDPNAPRTRPNIATPARAAAVAIEDQIRDQRNFEIGVFIDVAGTELARFHGNADQVSIPVPWLITMKGNTFTHNHPTGGTFSVEDIHQAAQYKLGEIRAVGSHFRHAASGFDAVWHGAVAVAYHESMQKLRELVSAKVRNDEISAASFTAELQHLAWHAVAKRLQFRYWRERS
jgi:hypothetical protein